MWGLGSLLFGVSLVRLGMAITNALVNGVVVFLGSLGPILMGAVHIEPKRMVGLMLGLGVLALSLGLCAWASISRDRAQGTSQVRAVSRSQSVLGVALAAAAGVFSSLLNIGFVYGAPLADKAKNLGCPAFLATVAIWVPVLLGGLVLNVGYPACLMFKGKSWGTFFTARAIPGAWLRSSLMGILWFGAVLLYGIGASTLGKAGTVYGWEMIVAVSILTSNGWGALTGEWKGSGSRPKLLMTLSTVLLIFSLAILALQQISS